MRESIGSTMMYSIIAAFIVIIFAILAGTMSYFKAYKINSRIVGIIEKYEGYNDLAIEEIDRTLGNIGYQKIRGIRCPNRANSKLYPEDPAFTYCVYLYCDSKDDYKYRFGVTTYITIEFPLLSNFIRIPLYTETNSIHLMSNWQCTLS